MLHVNGLETMGATLSSNEKREKNGATQIGTEIKMDTELPATSCPVATIVCQGQSGSAVLSTHHGSRCTHRRPEQRAAPGRRGREFGNLWFIVQDRKHSRGMGQQGPISHEEQQGPERSLPRLQFLKYFALFTEGQGREGISETFR